MSTEGDDFLRELVSGAARTEHAESDLKRLTTRITSFNVQVPVKDERSGIVYPDEIIEREAAASLGRMIMDHPDAVTKSDHDNQRRFTVLIVLKEKS